jgi:hypothetical protein
MHDEIYVIKNYKINMRIRGEGFAKVESESLKVVQNCLKVKDLK